MITIKSKSSKRMIVECKLKDITANFLIDTGACVSLIDDNQSRKYNLHKGKKYNGTLVGAGGEFGTSYICDDIFTIGDKQVNQFILADIQDVVDSIKRSTGITILGIIGLPQIKFANMLIDVPNDSIIIK